MKNTTKIFGLLGGVLTCFVSWFLMSSDQIDGNFVANTTVDIADFYAFEGQSADHTVFVVNLQGPLSIGAVSQEAEFDPEVLIEFNIDNTGDFKEDLVIQAIRRDSLMYFFGPVAITQQEQGLSHQVQVAALSGQVQISTMDSVYISEDNDLRLFAGPRRDPFFFDQARFNQIREGIAAPEGFSSPAEAQDYFAQSNVLSVVIEVPNELLGDAPPHIGNSNGLQDLPNAYNVWVSTKRKQ